MEYLRVPVLAELCLVFGLAGLLWPGKLMPVFDVLMFPWAASYRTVRGHSIAAIGVAVILLSTLLAGKS